MAMRAGREAPILFAPVVVLLVLLNPANADEEADAKPPANTGWEKLASSAQWSSLEPLLASVFGDCDLAPFDNDVGGRWHPRQAKACKTAQKKLLRKLSKQTIVLSTTARIVRLDETKKTVTLALRGWFYHDVGRQVGWALVDSFIGEASFKRYLLTSRTRDWWLGVGSREAEYLWKPVNDIIAVSPTIKVTNDEYSALKKAKDAETTLEDEIYGTENSVLVAQVALRLRRLATFRSRRTKNNHQATIQAVMAKPIAWRVTIEGREVYGRVK